MSPRSRFGSVYRKVRRDGTEYDGWFVRYPEAGERVERGGFATVDAATAFLAARRVEQSRARALGLAALRRVPVADAVDDFLDWVEEHRRASTRSAAGTHMRAFAARLGKRDVLSLRAEDVTSHLDALRRERSYAPATLHLVLRLIQSFLRWSIENHYARENVAHGLSRRLPRVDVEQPPYLAPDELRAIYAAIPREIRAQVVLMGDAGLRRGEAIGLRWSELRPDHSAVTIGAARSKGHRARVVPLTARAQEELAASLGAVPIDRSEPCFAVARTQFDALFRAAMERIGRRDVTPRTLRHAFASSLVRAGVDLPTVQRLLGHRAITTTMVYACHAPRDAGELAIRALEVHRSPPSDNQARKAT